MGAIKNSVGRDFLSGGKVSLSDADGDSFIGNLTEGGNRSYSMAPAEEKKSTFPEMKRLKVCWG